MTIVIPNSGESKILGLAITNIWYLGLYTNNYTPVPGTTWANFTELSESGYARTSIYWSGPNVDGSGRAWAEFGPSGGYDFSINSAMMPPRSVTVYGWFLVDVDSGFGGETVWMAEKFASPVTIGDDAITINVPRKKIRLYQP